jgi:hypothetical protein
MELKEGMKVRVLHTDYPDRLPVGAVTHIVRLSDIGADLWCDSIREGLYFSRQEFQPLPVADATEEEAPLKIEEGKYYRTRDGRKVGPAVPNHIAPISYPWNIPYDGAYHAYRVDGTSCIDDKDDVVAEWQDEPAADEATVPAAPKFKVGDRVRFITDYPQHSALHSDDVLTIIADNGDGSVEVVYPGGLEQSVAMDDLDLVSPIATNDNQVPVATTLNFNTTDANAKLDEIIAKLNLIDEMASELGISFTTQQAA